MQSEYTCLSFVMRCFSFRLAQSHSQVEEGWV